MLDQCTRQQWLKNQPGHCAHTDTISADIRLLRERGVESIAYEFWNRTESKLAKGGGGAEAEWADWRRFEADKTRHLLLHMLRWKPDAHFYLKARARLSYS